MGPWKGVPARARAFSPSSKPPPARSRPPAISDTPPEFIADLKPLDKSALHPISRPPCLRDPATPETCVSDPSWTPSPPIRFPQSPPSLHRARRRRRPQPARPCRLARSRLCRPARARVRWPQLSTTAVAAAATLTPSGSVSPATVRGSICHRGARLVRGGGWQATRQQAAGGAGAVCFCRHHCCRAGSGALGCPRRGRLTRPPSPPTLWTIVSSNC
jgi:hypothetical protein